MVLPLIIFTASYITLFQASTVVTVALAGLASVLSVTYLVLGTLLKIDNNSLLKYVDGSDLEG